ncbi:MAG: Rpn family recombination-promoting nuclease/putative transposase [Okeania sp. SIO2C2]|uniref:Rpn family recombination-promoting nuclease/putative transposase n=1 Tax=Okeania hirsuta TaxID=1458930 RepID=A0A3N6NZE3_9CYAN|nr:MULTISPECIES: hypothetical protein [Okeania]NEP04645.1 Rpn family recombination-promoting nuclease/putative transposase [Okeania sp. SIO4D6]NEP40177.1 Rpn family recombination-promoting nuclease/putative transposase [Okeania sp. SIO2H7]NEP70717.1 Rpn family recombination-promoting nuclease/putative transposase [Okeania sp. SIO2G5]NEP88327.1 Rpn family recombination-promoting nuclease/putative transposase [Okeania sp. SIO2C2]NEP93416.1 Rpn family recombination-promoting nuclease/putative tra
MFYLRDLKKTRFYQEAFLEGKEQGRKEGKLEVQQEAILLEKFSVVPNLINLGLTVEQIALAMELQVEQVSQFIDGENN